MYGFTGTVVGVCCGEGIALASDSRGTAYYHVLSKSVQKLFQIEKTIGAAIAGSSGDIQSFVKLVQSEANLYRLAHEQAISTKSLAQVAANMLHGRRYYPYILEGMISGYDEDGPHLFFLDPIGGKLDERKFAAAGSGANVAYGALENGYADGIKLSDAAKLAAQTIKNTIERDAATGDKTVVAVIDKKGYRELSEEEVNKLLKS